MIAAIIIGILILICILFLIRNTQVYRMRTKLLKEESDWLKEHIPTLVEKGWIFRTHERYDRLPSYDKMLLMFWKRMGSFEKDLNPIQDYYLKEG